MARPEPGPALSLEVLGLLAALNSFVPGGISGPVTDGVSAVYTVGKGLAPSSFTPSLATTYFRPSATGQRGKPRIR